MKTSAVFEAKTGCFPVASGVTADSNITFTDPAVHFVRYDTTAKSTAKGAGFSAERARAMPPSVGAYE